MSEEKTQTTEIKNKIKRKCKKNRTLKQKFYRSFKNSILNLSTFLISIILLVSIFSLLICVSTNYIKTNNNFYEYKIYFRYKNCATIGYQWKNY